MTAQWVTVAQAAKMANVTPSIVHRWVKAGKVTKVATGRAARVRLDQVLNAERSGRQNHGRGRVKAQASGG
ncbi:helix-turn-helix domain-containing protein [Mycetocola reblochoni]|uniref:Helix-turn-helix domain-containing protein n=1 Tax=Mycetocola reblochoni REB411 TaxID=1255698 RepID=A0A1R4JQI4_9MICO|nr:helix-turn-helix domain-containing protein [Mycetocola reblochoni]SJN34043.1 hypothetical protein FM119_08730 [Mycetocola reblochoni REB411]